MKRWEYKIVDLSGDGLLNTPGSPTESDLNALGEQDWALATAVADKTQKTDALVFKRPKA